MVNRVTPITHPSGPEYGHRIESLRVELLDLYENHIRDLPLVESVSLEGLWTSTVLWGGKITLKDPGDVDWLRSRLRIWYGFRAQGESDVRWFPRGVFIPATPTGPRVEGQSRREIEIYDKTQVFYEDKVPYTFSVEAGENVVLTAKNIVTEVEGVAPDIIEYDNLLRVGMSWKPGTPKINIIRDLLDTINMTKFQMRADGTLFSLSRNYNPDQVSWIFRDNQYEGLYLDAWEDEQDLYEVPNRWVGWTRSDGETEPMYSVAENVDPDSPFSFQNRGRWITRVTEDIDTTSEAVLIGIVQGNLTQATRVTRRLTIEHPWLPLELNGLVEFHNTERGIHAICRIRKIEEDLSLPGALQKTQMDVETLLDETGEVLEP